MCPGINGFTNYAPIADWSAPYGAAVRPEGRPSRLAHIAKCAMYAPPGRGGCPSQPTVGNEAGMCPAINDLTNHAPIAHWSAPLWCSRAPRGPTVAARTHRKMCDVCATRSGSVSADCWERSRNVALESNYAPIADWSARLWCSRAPRDRPSRLAHIAKCAMYAPPGREGCPSQPTVGNEAGM